ncbi:uncharacterized protein E5676_scaffold306G002040 [Cucumis melo var. makuwa]|uniref:Uncharacterized protein n=1 Tax=Cucumis melo var. makuwa TaxID=1194695 RepID=A0A5A7TJR3_CUCMM|nr:uncharacterized protein E6C27_scaffold67G004140 [Cucumis melo var. makuwa]TYK17913.1 uncharacterized protein E5676_scaffold306G002040 [Cucumis melo var. makuwa]
MDLFRELVWSSPSDGLQYSRIEEIDKIYDFFVGVNPKFDVVRECIKARGQFPPRWKFVLKSANATNISTTPTIDSAAFSARSFTNGSDKHNGKTNSCKKRSPNDKQNTGRAYVSESAEPSQPLDPHENQTDLSSSIYVTLSNQVYLSPSVLLVLMGRTLGFWILAP